MFHPHISFRPKLWSVLKNYRTADFWSDLSAGITVGIVALPLAMAFAIASGLKPESGIYTAIIAGFIIAAFGGSKVQIGGPAGAFIVVVYGIIAKYGIDGLIISTIISGFLLFLMGLWKCGTLIRFVPVSIIIGFTNGIAVLIALSQIKDVFGLKIENLPADFFAKVGSLVTSFDTLDMATTTLSAVSLIIVFGWSRVGQATGIKLLQRVPSSVVALVVGTSAVSLLGIPVETIGTKFGGIPSTLPSFTWPDISLDTIQHLIPPIITITLLGAIESLLCARVADGLIGDRHDPNQELMAQGMANVAAPLFGGYCATGTIARTITNIRSGGRTPIAGMIHALTLLAIILVAAPLALNVPLATLGAILLFVAYNMGEWHEFVRLRHFPGTYRAVLLTTFVLTVVVDLTVAVEVGLALAFLFFVTNMSNLTHLEPLSEIEAEGQAKLGGEIEAYRLSGTLFFGAIHRLEELMSPDRTAPKIIVLIVNDLINMDESGLDALKDLHKTLGRKGCRLLIAGAEGQPLTLMTRAGFIKEIGEDNIFENKAAALAHASKEMNQILPDNVPVY